MDPVAEHPAAVAGAPPTPGDAPPAIAAPPPAGHACAHCSAPLAAGQDWCLECGAGAPLAARGGPPWRPAATVLVLTAVLVIGTVAVAYAALSAPPHRTVVTRPPAAVALVSPAAQPATTTPTPAPPAVTAPTHTPPPAPASLLPSKAVTPPAAASTPAPAPAASTPAPSSTTSSTTTTHTTTSATSTPAPNPSRPAPSPKGAPVVLDPGGASTYTPGALRDGAFGDPSLSIDGDPSTAWSAQVPSGQASALDAGVVLDLNTRQRVSTLTLITHTPGQSVGIYGANGSAPPASITSAGWKQLSPIRRTKKTSNFTLVTSGTRYRFVLVWISTAAGPTADINEISLTH